MPDYKTHSIHSEVVYKDINKRTFIDKESLKKFAFGPDSLITTNYKLFDYQHSHDTRLYFETLISLIKERKLQDNGKVMAFLYGQLDHFVLDLVMHPLIYYMTEAMPSKYILSPHTLIEMWISDYVMMKSKRTKENYYRRKIVSDTSLDNLIDSLYYKTFKDKNASKKYKMGISSIILFDDVRFNKSEFLRNILNRINLGNIFYDGNILKIRKYLNLKRRSITNPISGVTFRDSFNDLWVKSLMIASELIEDVNNYLYRDIPLNNYLIRNNISYNTGFPCTDKEVFKYVKKYQ